MKLKPIKYITLLQKYNKIENDYAVLKNSIANNCFEELLSRITLPEQLEKLQKENKKLRNQVKTLKEIIKENK